VGQVRRLAAVPHPLRVRRVRGGQGRRAHRAGRRPAGLSRSAGPVTKLAPSPAPNAAGHLRGVYLKPSWDTRARPNSPADCSERGSVATLPRSARQGSSDSMASAVRQRKRPGRGEGVIADLRDIALRSAPALLLVILGEFVLPRRQPVWSSTLIRALGECGVEAVAARNASQ